MGPQMRGSSHTITNAISLRKKQKLHNHPQMLVKSQSTGDLSSKIFPVEAMWGLVLVYEVNPRIY